MPVSIESKSARKQIEFVANRQCAEVIECFRTNGELTREEVSQISGLKLQSVCARVNELVGANVLTRKLLASPDAKTGSWFATRKTGSRRSAAVLVLA